MVVSEEQNETLTWKMLLISLLLAVNRWTVDLGYVFAQRIFNTEQTWQHRDTVTLHFISI